MSIRSRWASQKSRLQIAEVKRVLDVLGAGLGLLVLSPLLTVISVLVWRFHGCPVLFVQERSGLGILIFKMCKFRIMTNEGDEHGGLLPDVQRLTVLVFPAKLQPGWATRALQRAQGGGEPDATATAASRVPAALQS